MSAHPTLEKPTEILQQMLGQLKQMVEQEAGEGHPQALLVQRTMTYLRLNQKELEEFLLGTNVVENN